jgi:HEPN domain-containing protein
MSKSLEHALLLLEKADEDLLTMRELIKAARCPQAAFGFHAQQTAEKSIKAVLTSRAIRFPWTHDLSLLIDLLVDAGIPGPPDARDLPSLTPFAAEFRYGRLPREGVGATTLDPHQMLAWGSRTRPVGGAFGGGAESLLTAWPGAPKVRQVLAGHSPHDCGSDG